VLALLVEVSALDLSGGSNIKSCCVQYEEKNFATLKNSIHNFRKQHLQHRESNVTVGRINIRNIETSRSTFATSARNTCNIRMKHLKHVEYTLATCNKNSTKKKLCTK
jgi:hypothetical protein